MASVKFTKGKQTVIVTDKDYNEYCDWLEGKKEYPRVLQLLKNNEDDYMEIMGTFAEVNAEDSSFA